MVPMKSLRYAEILSKIQLVITKPTGAITQEISEIVAGAAAV